MKAIFIAGPYRADTPWEIEQNIRRAEEAALVVAQAGAVPLCPHTMYRFFQGVLEDKFWLGATTDLLIRCDAGLLVGNWESSEGTRVEMRVAGRLSIPIYDGPLCVEGLREWIEEEVNE